MTISQLRKLYPKSMLGYREKEILSNPKAKVVKSRNWPGCMKVSTSSAYFVFTYGKKGYKDFTVVN